MLVFVRSSCLCLWVSSQSWMPMRLSLLSKMILPSFDWASGSRLQAQCTDNFPAMCSSCQKPIIDGK